MRTDAKGMRVPPPQEKLGDADHGTTRTSTVRIVGLGDSFMFGLAVTAEDSYLGRIQKKLAHDHPRTRWDVVNTAVPGYNTVMEVATLKRKALDPKPDLVLIGWVGNDLGLPHFVREHRDYFTVRRCFLLERVMLAFAGEERTPAHGLMPSRAAFGEPRDPAQVPAPYRHLVGVSAFRRAMTELAALGKEHGFEILAFANTFAPDCLKDVCKELDLPLIECGVRLHAWLSERGIPVKDYIGSPLTVSAEDPHPSALGHRLIAEALGDYLRTSGMISRLVARPRPGR